MTLVPIEHRNFVPRFLAFGNFTAPISAQRLEQMRNKVRPPLQHFVVDCHRADKRRGATRLCRLEAEQADDVTGVRVKRLTFPGLVDPRGRIIDGVTAKVTHMTQDMSLAILRAGTAEVSADTEIGGCRLAH